jgi:hypothetical protein
LRFEQIRIIHLSVPTITAAAAVPHFARIPTDDSRNKFHICAPVGNRNKKTRWKKAIRRDRILPKKSVFCRRSRDGGGVVIPRLPGGKVFGSIDVLEVGRRPSGRDESLWNFLFVVRYDLRELKVIVVGYDVVVYCAEWRLREFSVVFFLHSLRINYFVVPDSVGLVLADVVIVYSLFVG